MLEGYITPLLTSYLNKYIKNIKPSDLKLSFWGGDAVLTNLELKLDAIEESLRGGAIPFDLKSGSVKQLTLHIPWTSIGSESIIITLDSVECTLKLHDLSSGDNKSTSNTSLSSSGATKTTPTEGGTVPGSEQPPSYISGLLSRIGSNIVIKVTNLLLKIVEEHSDLLFSISIKELTWFTADSSWKRNFVYTDNLSGDYYVHKVCVVTGATVCLDVIGGCGQVESYDDPFLPQCNFECRWRASYHGNIISENRIEVFVKEARFSVSESQFVSFLHFIDWCVAVYYMSKKLKGRDDDKEEEIKTSNENISPPNTPPKATPFQTTPPQEEGWGSWFMSLVVEDDKSTTPISNTPSTLPNLLLGFYIQLMTIDFKVTHKKPHPVFFSNSRRNSWSVLRLQFDGCTCRIDKIPSSKHLGVSLGIMAVNGWIGGACPCTLVTMAMRKYHKISSSNSDATILPHVYSLGNTQQIDICGLQLVNSLFTTNEGGVTTPLPPGHNWLDYKPEYCAVWFTYNYHDILPPERNVETCQECIKVGTQSILLSTDVIHRLEFFINKFIVSLEATPLVSQELIILGDPVAVTNLSISSEAINIHLPFNTHLYYLTQKSHDPIDKSHDLLDKSHDLDLVVPSLFIIFQEILVDVTMAMYSNNATPTYPQQSLIKGIMKNITLNGNKLLGTRQTSIENCQTGLLTKNDILIHELVIDIHSNTDGSVEGTTLYMQIEINRTNLQISFHNLLAFLTVCYSWISSPLSPSSLPFPLIDHNATTNTAINGNFLSFNLQLYRLSTKRTISSCLGEIKFYFVTNNDIVIPVLSSPTSTGRYIKAELWAESTIGHVTTDDRVFEVCLIDVPNEQEGESSSLSFKLGGVVIYIPSLLTSYLESFVPLLYKVLSSFTPSVTEAKDAHDERKINVFRDIDRPDPEGIQSLVDSFTPPSPFPPPLPLSSSSLPEEEEEEGKKENEKDKDKESNNTFLSFLQSYSVDIYCEHVLILFPSLQSQAPSSNTPLINILSDKRQEVIIFALPQIQVLTTPTHPTHNVHHQYSWKLSLLNCVLSMNLNGHTSYMLHPLSVSISIAPSRVGGANTNQVGGASYGVHANVDLLQITLRRHQIMILQQMISNLYNILSSFFPPPSLPPPPPTITESQLPNQQSSLVLSPSLVSSPHLSALPPPPLSDSSTSLFSAHSPLPSLWLQLTMGKLMVGVSSSGLVDEEMYMIEGDEISLSLDLQEKRNNFQFKLSSLEAKGLPHNHSTFSKLFSSNSTVVTATVAKEIEAQFGSVLGASLSTGLSSSSLNSFLLINVTTFKDESRSMSIKMNVQTFEAVFWLPLVTSVLDIISIIVKTSKDTTREDEKERSSSSFSHGGSINWPSLDIKFNSFCILFPSPCSPSSLFISSILLFGCDGFNFSSHFDYPVSRMIINSSALRRLNIGVAEKRTPPLPGYHMTLYSAQFMGIKHQGMENRFISFPLSLPTDVKSIYSPALYISPKGGHYFMQENKLLVATGHLLEVHFVSKVMLYCGYNQVECIGQVCSSIINLFKPHPLDRQQPTSNSDPWQLLITGKTLTLTTTTKEKESKEGKERENDSGHYGELHLSAFNPVLIVTMTTNSCLNIDFSLFDMTAGYYSNSCHSDHNPIQVIETREGSLNKENDLSAGLVTIKWKRQYCSHEEEEERRGYVNQSSLNVQVTRSIGTHVTTGLILLLLKYTNMIANNLTSLLTSHLTSATTTTVKPAPNTNDLTKFELSVCTRQLICIVQGSDTTFKGSGDICEGSDNFVTKGSEIVLSCEYLTISQPSILIENDMGSQNIGMFQSQISIEGLELCINDSKLIPYSIICCEVMYISPKSIHDSGQVQVSVNSDWFKMVLSKETLSTLHDIINDYLSLMETTNELFIQNGLERDEKKKDKENENKVIIFHDDIRSGTDLTIIADNVEVYRVPSPGEIRFYNGGNTEECPPATMMWCYKEDRSLINISILPVPLGIVLEEDWPMDIKVVCELSYYTNNDWMCVSTVYLSEVSSITQSFTTSNKDLPVSVLWRLALVALEWTEGTDIHRVSLPLSDLSTVTILSPLVLAGCTCVDSMVKLSSNTKINIDFLIRSLEVTFVHQPLKNDKKMLYKGGQKYQVLNDLLHHEIDLFNLTAAELKGIVVYSHDIFIEFKGEVSLLYIDMRDLVWRYLLYPTELCVEVWNKTVKQERKYVQIILNSSSLALFRISPSFLYTVSMTANTLLRQQEDGITLIGAPYIIINKTSIDVTFGQVSTIESIFLPAGTCYGYTWKSLDTKKKIHICINNNNSSSEYKWSSDVSIDSEGIQKLSMNNKMDIYAHVTNNGGIQKLVTILGGLCIISRLTESLFIRFTDLSSSSSLPYTTTTTTTTFSNNSSRESIVVEPLMEYEGLMYAGSSNLSVQLYEQRDVSSCTLIPLVVTTEPFIMEIPKDDKQTIQCWCTVSKDHALLKVTFAPLFEVRNYLPLDLSMILTDASKASITTTNHIDILLPKYGHTTTTPTCIPSVQSDVIYSVQFTAGNTCFSRHQPEFEISTSIWDELPLLDNECLGPYEGNCTCLNTPKWEKFVSIPIKEEERGKGKIEFRVVLWKRNTEATIRIELYPLVLINNQLIQYDIFIKRQSDGEICLSSCEYFPLSTNENIVLTIKEDQSYTTNILLTNDQQTVSTTTTTAGTRRINLLSDTDSKLEMKLLLDVMSPHNGCVLYTLKPLFVVTNKTSHNLSLYPSHDSLATRERYWNVPSNGTIPLLSWYKGHKNDSSFVIRVSSTGSNCWSIPLSLNFVRRSFSLPTSSGDSSYPILLTTHENKGRHFIVFSYDPKPRLILTNHTSLNLELVEYGVQGIHAHPQTLYPSSETYFEPPSLASIYPLIEMSKSHKTLSDISIQLRLSHDLSTNDLSQSNWTSPIPIQYDTQQTVTLYSSDVKLSLSTSHHNNTLYISLLPINSPPLPIKSSHQLLVHEYKQTLCQYSASIVLDQVIVAVDKEDTLRVETCLRLILDDVNIDISRSLDHNQLSFDLKSLQIDHLHKDTMFPVVCIPQQDHSPKLKIIQDNDKDPFIVLKASWIMNNDNSGEICINEVSFCMLPLTVQVDDTLIMGTIMELIELYSVPSLICNGKQVEIDCDRNSNIVPLSVLLEAERDTAPLVITKLNIHPITLHLSIHTSRAISISADESVLSLSPLILFNVYSNWNELFHWIGSHYSLSFLSQAGWILGSLDIIGSPLLLCNKIRSGFTDFVSLPYEGLTLGPGFFILGLGQGVASLLSGVTGGILRSVTNFTSGVAENFERLSLDPEHVNYQETLRRRSSRGQRSSEYIGAGLVTGMSSFGMSVMSAVAGIVEQPLSSIHQTEDNTTVGYTKSILSGVGKGLLGVVTKPVGGALQLVSYTGHEIISSVGFKPHPQPRSLSHVISDHYGIIDKSLCLLQPTVYKFINTTGEDHSSFIFSSFNGILQSSTTDNKYTSLFYFTNDSLNAIDVKNGSILQKFSLINHHCIIIDTIETHTTIISLEENGDHDSIEQCGERLLHCTLTGAIQTNDKERRCGYEIVIATQQVTTFISLFEKTKNHLKNRTEFFCN